MVPESSLVRISFLGMKPLPTSFQSGFTTPSSYAKMGRDQRAQHEHEQFQESDVVHAKNQQH